LIELLYPSRGDGKGPEMPPESDQVRAAGDGDAVSGQYVEFSVRPERINGVYRLRVSGELDLATRDMLGDELRRAEASEAKRILLDLAELTFIDSIGVAVLLEAHERSATDGTQLRIVSVDGQVRQVLKLTGLVEVLDIED
jgi:anti-sigma B factor antagonist